MSPRSSPKLTRRSVLASTIGLPLLSVRATQPIERILPWADVRPTEPTDRVRYTELSGIETRLVPNESFFALQHHGVPNIDVGDYELEIRVEGKPVRSLSFSMLQSMPSQDLEVCFECAGNGGFGMHGLVGNARWTGVPLGRLVEGLADGAAREVVFYGADAAEERLRGNRYPSRFARSLPIQDALHEGVIVAYRMNGEPLRPEHGFPARLVVPGWYGIAQVKWLSAIDVVAGRFMGWYMSKDYVTVRGYEGPGATIEHRASSVGRQRLKSIITRVTQRRRQPGSHLTIHGLVWNDGSPIDNVQISIDGGPFRDANVESRRSRFAWTSFSLPWRNAVAGRHRLVSRARDDNGVQPEAEEASSYKATPWENDGQVTREIVLP